MSDRFEDAVLPIHKPVEEQLQWALGRIDSLERAMEYYRRDSATAAERLRAQREAFLRAKAEVAQLQAQMADDAARDRSDVAYLEGKVRRQRVRLRQFEELRLAESERRKVRDALTATESGARADGIAWKESHG